MRHQNEMSMHKIVELMEVVKVSSAQSLSCFGRALGA